MKQQLPSDRLTRPRRPLRTVLIAAGAAVVLAGAGVGAAVAAPAVFPQPTPTRTLAFVPAPQTGSVNRAPAVTAGQEQTAMAQADKLAADKATADAAAAAAKQAAAAPKAAPVTTTTSHPKGTPLPMRIETDPNNGNYGKSVPSVDPGSWCDNHSASTINGVPTCD